jgi:hypothetical protein
MHTNLTSLAAEARMQDLIRAAGRDRDYSAGRHARPSRPRKLIAQLHAVLGGAVRPALPADDHGC